MTHWLYPANTKFYDVLGAFSQPETYWPVNSKVAIGDLVYIYLAAPHKQIGFVSEILEIGLPKNDILEQVRPFFKSEPKKDKPDKPFMKLRNDLTIKLEHDSPFSLVYLKANGLGGMLMGPRKLENKQSLLDYIKGIEDELR